MKKALFAAALFCVVQANAAFVELKTVSEFEDLIKTSNVPVIVQFEAYWCGPCQNLKATFNSVASKYQDTQVRLAHIDAYVNSKLQSYLKGGYPTVRTFSKGSLGQASFVGSQSASYVTNFIDKVISGTDDQRVDEFEVGAMCPVE